MNMSASFFNFHISHAWSFDLVIKLQKNEENSLEFYIRCMFMWVIKRLSSSADKPRSPHTMDAIKSRVFVCPDDDLGRWPAKQDSTQRGRWRRVFAWTNQSEEMQKKIKLCRQMQLHYDGLWPRLRVGNCLASYLGIAAIDAAHKSARRAQEDIEATGQTFEGGREKEGDRHVDSLCGTRK